MWGVCGRGRHRRCVPSGQVTGRLADPGQHEVGVNMVGVDRQHRLQVALRCCEIMLRLQDSRPQHPQRYGRFRFSPPRRQRALRIADKARVGLGNANAQLMRCKFKGEIGIARMLGQCHRQVADRPQPGIGARQNPLQHQPVICRNIGRGTRRRVDRADGQQGDGCKPSHKAVLAPEHIAKDRLRSNDGLTPTRVARARDRISHWCQYETRRRPDALATTV